MREAGRKGERTWYTRAKLIIQFNQHCGSTEPGPVLGGAGALVDPGPTLKESLILSGETQVDTDPSDLWAGIAQKRQ